LHAMAHELLLDGALCPHHSRLERDDIQVERVGAEDMAAASLFQTSTIVVWGIYRVALVGIQTEPPEVSIDSPPLLLAINETQEDKSISDGADDARVLRVVAERAPL